MKVIFEEIVNINNLQQRYAVVIKDINNGYCVGIFDELIYAKEFLDVCKKLNSYDYKLVKITQFDGLYE